ncbi:uncharacterized protein [Phyllobates terribilis]|uniref:uncharacterized protein isoform X2 n=1 Tax=Phyllobates terribilis TaxID=111132 RepID=UPI003CCB24F2
MDIPNKRPRLEEWIRLSDGFRRTEMNVICPVMKAESSVRVLYRLQEKKLIQAIEHAGNSIGLKFEDIQFDSPSSSRSNEGNLFVKFISSHPCDENLCSKLKESLEERLKETMVKDILVERVDDSRPTIPQPLISEYDFEMHKLKLCLRELDGMKKEIKGRLDIDIENENIESNLQELSKSYTKFAILSQNGTGKSFLLNLLMLMTADNDEEYSENNRNLRVPNEFPDNTLVKDLGNTDLQNLPVVVQKFVNKIDMRGLKKDDKRDFKSLMEPICHQLQDVTNNEPSLNDFSSIGEYFTHKRRLDIEPYFLSQKDIPVAYESTTKCIIHLRYGTLYEMRVEYFKKSELQEQLYELVTMGEEGTDENTEITYTAQDCLTERFQILTGESFSEEMKKRFKSSDDITFSPDVLEFAGKTKLYFGQGKNPTHDRLSLKSILRSLTAPQEDDEAQNEICKKQIAAVKKIVVYLPCKILYDGKEILEMPGTDDSDPIAMNFIAEALKKDSNCQFASGDERKIKLLDGNKKRAVELKEIRKILHLDTFSNKLEEQIFTSYILPVLHTSILVQDHKPEYEVLSKYDETFLKYTGVQNLIMNLDELVLSRQSSIFEGVKSQLCHFQNEINSGLSVENAKSILKTLSVKSDKRTIEEARNRPFQEIERNLFKKLKDMLSEDASEMVKTKLDALCLQAIRRWNQKEPEVKSIGVFSPYFCGKNPRYRVCLYPILFEDENNQNNIIYETIMQKIQEFLQEYKQRAIALYVEELNKNLSYDDRSATCTSEFVEGAIGDQLDNALKWYQGKKQRPFNEKAMEKHLDESQKKSLKEVILKPNFNKSSLEEAKKKTSDNIGRCIEKVHEHFINQLIRLHDHSWKRLYSKLWTPNGTSKIWQQLVAHLKALCKDADGDNYKENINNLIKMINSSFI